ncbi:MAG: ADP-ribosylglycohydrolase family protein [Dehalococcoidia bacterium]
MELLRNILGGLVVLLGLSVIAMSYIRQIRNILNSRRGTGGWSSPAPLVGPVLVVLGGWLLPLHFGWWVLIAFLVDPDTVIVLIGLPWLFRGLVERDHSDSDTKKGLQLTQTNGFIEDRRGRAQMHIVGSILGTAVGDAMGLPYEGLSRRRGERLIGPPDRHHFFFGRGMVSDDTELTCMVAQSIIASRTDVGAFQRQLSRRLRLWLLGLPAGIGWATLRSTLRLWIGFSAEKSGVFSAGIGPAVRAPVIGAAIDDIELSRRLLLVSTRMTHTDPKAQYGASAVALASRMARRNETVAGADFLHHLQAELGTDGDELVSLIRAAVHSVDNGQSTAAFAAGIGLAHGVSGYVYHTVPVSIHAWLSHQRDFRSAITNVIDCGGDTDSTGAIVGGIVGASVGRAGIPAEWIERLFEWPRSINWMERLAVQMESTLQSNAPSDAPVRPIELPVYGVLLRNLLFLVVVLYHSLRRWLPPY